MGEEEKQVGFQVCPLCFRSEAEWVSFRLTDIESDIESQNSLATVALRIPHCNCSRGKASLGSFCSSSASCSQLHTTVCHSQPCLCQINVGRGGSDCQEGALVCFAILYFKKYLHLFSLQNQKPAVPVQGMCTVNINMQLGTWTGGERGDVVLTARPLAYHKRGRSCLWQWSDPLIKPPDKCNRQLSGSLVQLQDTDTHQPRAVKKLQTELTGMFELNGLQWFFFHINLPNHFLITWTFKSDTIVWQSPQVNYGHIFVLNPSPDNFKSYSSCRIAGSQSFLLLFMTDL